MVVINMGNADQLLDAGMLYVHIWRDHWQQMRRDTETRGIGIPFMYGKKGRGVLTEKMLQANRDFDYQWYRHRKDVPRQRTRK